MNWGTKGMLETFLTILAALGGVEGLRRTAELFWPDKAREAAWRLDDLGFTSGEVRPNLEKIARGEGTGRDLAMITWHMTRTNDEVVGHIRRLEQYEGWLRDEFGRGAAELLWHLIHGSVGKNQVRRRLETLTEMGRAGASQQELEAEAAQIAPMIDAFEANLTELHDRVVALRRRR